MHAAIWSPIRLLRKAHLADRPKLLDERRHMIGRALAVRDEIEHRVFRLAELSRRVLRVRHHEATRSPQRRLIVTGGALVAVEAGSQAG